MNLIIYTFLFSFVNCYSYKTHGYLGLTVEQELKNTFPNVLERIKTKITDKDFSNISTWADRIKRTKQYAWTRQLHYIDITECNENNIPKLIERYCENNKCIPKAMISLFSGKMGNLTIEERFNFLMHFTQDINQPLHLYGFYRGGNSFKVVVNRNGRNKTTNYHYLWDSIIPEHYIKVHNPQIKYEIIDNFDNVQYEKLLYNIVKINLGMTCKKDFSSYIIFEEYFNEKIMETLFYNYYTLMMNTLINF